MLAKSPSILIDLPPNMTSWVSTPTIDVRLLGTGRDPFTALQAEHQADHHDKILDGEVRIGRRG